MEIDTVDLIQAVMLDTGYNKRASTRIVNSFMKLFLQSLRNGMTVELRGFGIFSIKKNIDKPNSIYYKYEVIFTPSRRFKASINGKL